MKIYKYSYSTSLIYKLFILFALYTASNTAEAKTIYDTVNMDISSFFNEENVEYVIRHYHAFGDTLRIPSMCKLRFEGGALCGPIVFNQTYLAGRVNLKGSTICGDITNKQFNAQWLCSMDGITDDAKCINDIISICKQIYFPKGKYMLKSIFNPGNLIPKEFHTSVKTHIAIYRSDIKLIGEKGAEFIVNDIVGCICIFSKPYKIDNSIGNIEISGLTFSVDNKGDTFYEHTHTIKVIGVNGIIIRDCLFNDFWGDAICLSHYVDTPQTGERTRNQNVNIVNNTIIGGNHHNNRNGISVINGKKVYIADNIIKNTSRNDMPGGIDIEPNNSAYTIEDISVVNNIFDNIHGSGGAICVVAFNDGPAHNISIIGNHISKCNNGILIYVKTNYTTHNFLIKDNFINNDTHPYRFTGTGKSKNWVIVGNNFSRTCNQKIPGDIDVENLIIKGNKYGRLWKLMSFR